MCFVWIWEQTAVISLYSTDWQIFVTETVCVYCAVRTVTCIRSPIQQSLVIINFSEIVLQNPATTERVEKLPDFKEPEISLPCSQNPVTVACSELRSSHIWHSIPRSLKLSLSFRLNHNIFCSFPLPATRATCTAHSHPPPFHIANDIMGRVRPFKLSLLTVLVSRTLSSLSRSNIYSLSYSERIYTFFLGWQTRFCTHRKQNRQLS